MSISSPGIGSGLNVNDIVTKQMALEGQGLTRLQTQQSKVDNQISAIGKIKSALDNLQTAAKAMSTASGLYSYKGTLADTSIATVATNSNAVGGTYSVEIERLASTHKLLSAAAADPSAGGTLTIELGSTASGSFVRKSGTSAIDVTINPGSTLADVAKAINASDAGVSATVVNGASGAQLVVTSEASGETNQIKISTALSGFAFNPDAPATAGNLTQKDPGQDAILKIDGITIANASSNVVTDAITGVTLTLTETNDNAPTTLTVANDASGLQSKAEAFVKAYNDARSILKDLSKYDATGKNTGILNGDSTVSSAVSQLRSALSSIPSGVSSAYSYLADIGIVSNSDGTLKLDATTLKSATDKDFASVAKTLSAYGTSFATLTGNMIGVNGLITARSEGLSTQSDRLDDQIDQMNRQLALVEKRYRAQFTALDTMMAKFSTTSSYLSQQLSQLSK